MFRLIVHATNISQGGGKSLLSAFLSALPSDVEVLAQLDSRMILPAVTSEIHKIRLVRPTILQRLLAEWWLVMNVKSSDLVICFGSLSPLFKLRGHTTVFVQNRYLIEKKRLTGFPLKTRLRLAFERVWLALTASNADEFIVQSPAMKAALLLSGFVKKQPIHVRPFVGVPEGYQRTIDLQKSGYASKAYDFIYVASGEPHKNHRQLVEAWCLLAEQNLFPSLCLTLNKNVSEELCAWIDVKKNNYGLKLTNVGFLPHDQVLTLYSQTRALIYPSRFESFGLPLIEAIQAGLTVLAAELDYVRDVLDPEQSFDPDSPASIARAVKRYLGVEEPSLQLSDAQNFIHLILQEPR
jgi:glycosyltransferase involved in cell wall biosynthesis